jgi:hypothetical protein
VKGCHTRQSAAATAPPPNFNGQYQHGGGDEKQVSKAKKFLKPSKEGMKVFFMWIDFQLWILPFSTGPPRTTEER